MVAGLVSFPVLLVETAVLLPPESTLTWWALFNILVYPVIVALCMLAHEGGHAVVARAVGLQVPRIDLGVGRRIARWRWRQTVVSINAFPILGLTFVGADSAEGLRWRVWLAILAGPVVTAVIASISIALLDVGVTELLWPRHAIVIGPAILELIAFHTIWSLVLNVLPLQVFVGHGFRNDGTQLLRIPRVHDEEIRELVVVSAVLEAEELRESDQFDAAHEVISRALQTAPNSRALRNTLAILLMHREQLHEARALLLDLVQDKDSLETLALRNNLAWVDFLIHSDDLRSEADESSSLAQQRFKYAAFALGTRGAVLGWLGRHDEAIEMLKNAYARNSSPGNRALNACSLACSLAAKGQTAEAERWLSQARVHHPKCPLLMRAEAAIAVATESRVKQPVQAAVADVAER